MSAATLPALGLAAPVGARPTGPDASAEAKLWAACWPTARLGEALGALARHGAGRTQAHAHAPALADAPTLPPALESGPAEEQGRWLQWAAARLGLEAEPVDTPVPQAATLLCAAGPALLQLRTPQGPGLALLLGRRGRWLRLLGPDGRVQRCAPEALRAALCAPFEAPLRPGIIDLLDAAQVPTRRQAAASAALLAERLADQRLDGCWLLRAPAGESLRRQALQAGLHHRLLAMLALMAAVYGLEIAGWRLIGEAALDGRLDLGWLLAWALLLLTMVPLQALGGWLEARLGLDAGRLLKQRLLAGTLRLDLDAVRHQGAGQLLGQVMDAQALESLALNGGLSVGVAALELLFAGWILSQGAAPGLQLALLAGSMLVLGALGWRHARRLRAWTAQRVGLTHALVEAMVGHRTRLAQDRPGRRHAEDDAALDTYLHSSRAMDQSGAPLMAAAPRAWIVLGLAGLAPAFVAGQASTAALAISLGGVLFAHRAFVGIATGLGALAGAGIAGAQVAASFRAGAAVAEAAPFVPANPPASALPTPAEAAPDHAATGPRALLVDAQGLVFGHRPSLPPVLRGVDLAIHHGERLLLQGDSGGGKSTLAALLVGLRQPQSGLLLLDGLDRHTLGAQWQRGATEAPQFHENHLLNGSLGFNLLLGRDWPAPDAALDEARVLCEALGLGELIARMPSGLMQPVGETGWQLSHGERSRVFLARALLQRAPLTLLDESFAALDPETLRRCLQTARDEADTLLVIAHP